MNTDIYYYRTFFGLVYFCKCCEVGCAMCVWRRKASACLKMLSTIQVATGTIFNAFGMARPRFEPTTSRSRSGCSTTEPAAPDCSHLCFVKYFKLIILNRIWFYSSEVHVCWFEHSDLSFGNGYFELRHRYFDHKPILYQVHTPP